MEPGSIFAIGVLVLAIAASLLTKALTTRTSERAQSVINAIKGSRASFRRSALVVSSIIAVVIINASPARAASEAELKLPDLRKVSFLGIDGHTLLMFGLI